ncbi:BglG family transcription antiterminator [Sporolactobacillus pectinivorans]|uniref:BglG family transcription antiterminator n=1 Tax=Sporolactobacillus pectinivorans TaxID=1591408 RepID=UPI000C25F734|nr:BglG family transcription antiterminator [Sporolactobacillus pectinivorans]
MGLEEREMIKHILAQNNPSLNEIENNLSKSKDEIVQIIHSINTILPHESIEVVDGDLSISDKCADELYGLLIGEHNLNSYDRDVELRKCLIEVELMVHQSVNSLQTLSEQFYVSRNTMFADIKQLKEELKALQLGVNYSRRTGYQIKGPEYLLRNQLVHVTRNLLKTAYGKSCLARLNFIDRKDVTKLKDKLALIEEKTQIRLTDEQVEDLPYVLAILMERIRSYPEPWNFKIEKYDIRNTLEFPVIKEELSDFSYLKEIDVLYFSLHILSSNRIESALDFSNSEEIRLAVNLFVDTLKRKLAVKFIKETDFKEKILLHIQPAIFRNILGFRVNNPLTNRFMSEHYDIFMTVADAAAPFEQIIGHELSDEEIAYLSMIVLGWLYQSEEENGATYFKAVVLCPNGTSVSKLLLENLKDMFPQIEFVGAFSFRQFEKTDMALDFIFTTIPIQNRATTIIVPPFLEPESRRELRATVSKLLKRDPGKQAKSIISAIKNLIPEDKIDLVESKLKTFFDDKSESDIKNNKAEKMWLREENISLIDDYITWQNCVAVAFTPLFSRKTVNDDYVDRTKRIFYKNYNHMLIGPKIYLPHAEPTDDTGRADIQITIFKHAVINPEGIPFNVIVGLVPSRLNNHVPLLLKLNDFFLKKESSIKMIHAETAKTVLELIEGGECVGRD